MANPDLEPGALSQPPKGSAKRARLALKRLQQKVDRRESEKVKERSGGWCEVVEEVRSGLSQCGIRCNRAAGHVHHMLYGRGMRGRGESCLAIRKQAVCADCHLAITGDIGGKKLIRVGGAVPHYTDRYRRA